jgi:type IV pilus assembly protein PilB
MPPLASHALMQGNLLNAAQVETIVKKAGAEKISFVDAMVQSGELPARDLATFCSETFGYPLLDISALNESMLPEKLVELKLIITQKILPIAKKGNKLYLAVSDPTNNSVLDQVKFQSGLALELVIVHHDVLSKIIEKISKTSEQALNDLGSDDFDVDFKEEDVAAAVPDAQANEVDDAPIVKFLTKC